MICLRMDSADLEMAMGMAMAMAMNGIEGQEEVSAPPFPIRFSATTVRGRGGAPDQRLS